MTDTSNEAYERLKKTGRAESYKLKIYEYIKTHGPKTCDELESLLNLSHQTVSSRIWQLKKDELIKDNGERRVTRSGSKAQVMRVTNDSDRKQLNFT